MNRQAIGIKMLLAGACMWMSLSLDSCHLIFPYSTRDYPKYNPYYCSATIYRELPGGEEFSEVYTTYLWPDQDYDHDGKPDDDDAYILASAKIDEYIEKFMAPGFAWKKRGITVFQAGTGMEGVDCADIAPLSPPYGGPWGSALSWQDPDGSGPGEIPVSDAYVWIKFQDNDGTVHIAEPLLEHALVTLAERTGRPDDQGGYIRTDRHIRVSHMEMDLKPFQLGEINVTDLHIHNIGSVLTDKYGNFAAFEPDTIKLYMSARGEQDGESGTTKTCMLNDRGTQINYVIYPQYFLFNLDTQFEIGGLPLWVKLKLTSNYGKPFNIHQPYVSLPSPEHWVMKSPVDLEPYFSYDHDNDLWGFLWFENFEAANERFLGKGEIIPDLFFSAGKHEITIVAYDNQGAYHSSTSVLTIAPPDNCTDALLINDGQHPGTLAAATHDGSASCDHSSGPPDFWFRYQVRAPGILSLSTCGTNDLGGEDAGMDTVLSLHANCADISGSELQHACNDDWIYDPLFTCLGMDSGAALDSSMSVPVEAGQDILIRVSKNTGSDASDFLLNVSLAVENRPGDFDKDSDVDGKDLSGLCTNPARLGLNYFAPDFGR